MNILPVILCEGSGTRLWPLSREQYPKQLLPLLGETSLLQATLNRLTVEALPADSQLLPPMVISNAEYRFLVAEQLRQSGVKAHIVLEPCGRNTAPALTVATLLALRDISEDAEEAHDPLLVVMPADHAVGAMSAFQEALRQALVFAATGKVVTLGVVPSGPETGFGYIREGATLVGECHEIAAFVEKPDAATARAYLDSGDYLWNSGIFVLRASVWLEQIKRHRPEILAACEKAVAGREVSGDFTRLQAEAFAACPSDSIDYAIMERLTGASGVVVPLDANWSDVGSWGALWEIGDKDASGNLIQGDVLALDNRNCYLRSVHRLVACVGLSDAVVVETPDAVLVAHRDHLQSIRAVVARLKQEKRPEADTHRKVFRPWGYYDSLDSGAGFQVKRIVVDPGASLSLQMHHHRAEHWIVVSGTAKVTIGARKRLLSENQSTYIPLGTLHRLENPGRIPLEMIEVQSGDYLGEDDIVRFEDSYGRNCKNQ
ncbi:mannose-1-phosphate guanylyltransferase/mannose-6-phosphate isomerase [Betaproteobacteria bacterium]|nr:mannose-1-phosphate guanylyltransferase/mannose-6-phosphate isomerase [Betaproteobacteria bacterium]